MVKGAFVSARVYIAFLAVALCVMGVLTVKQKYDRAEFEREAAPKTYTKLVDIVRELRKKYDHIQKADGALFPHIRSMPPDMRALALKALLGQVRDYFFLATEYNANMASWKHRFANHDLLPEGALHGVLPERIEPVVFIQSGEEA